jgi:uncharacterized protein YndB with AHSA1/START domain
MRTFDVQAVEILAPREKVFEFISDPRNLTEWARAFEVADSTRARLETPDGPFDIGLETAANRDAGTIDWRMVFPDGSVGIAQSRVTATGRGTSIYTFVLHAPPVSLERIEGALDAQRAILATELATLKTLLEASPSV